MTDFRIVSKNVTPEEVAAVTAVLQSALEEQVASPVVGPAPVSAWQRNQRTLRHPLRPGPGAWRGFVG